jgi:hypothetical protein
MFPKVAILVNLTVASEETKRDMAKTFEQPENKSRSKPSHEEIAKRACEIFEQSGCKPGRDVENWLAAEAELSRAQKRQTQASSSVKPMARTGNRESAERPSMRTGHA